MYFLISQDFLTILSKVSRGTVQEKLQWIFGLYDLNRDGYITKEEMRLVVSSIYEMLGESTEPQVNDYSAADHVEKIFDVSMFQNNIIFKFRFLYKMKQYFKF